MPVSTQDGRIVADRVVEARSFMARLKGWMFRDPPELSEALFIPGCASVHTFFVRFPMDLLFLDRDSRVLSIREDTPPWRLAGHPGADSTLELAAGRTRALGIRPGHTLRIEGEAA